MTDIQVAVLLLDLGLVVALAGLAGLGARALGQPAVIGEIVAGILIGPTLFRGHLASALLPVEIRPFLSAFANLGVVLFMFAIGLELDRSRLRSSGRVAVAVALGSATLPFGLGCLLALHLAGHHRTVNHLAFVLFIGVALAVTAFPVLARIIADRNLSHTRIGTIALSSAAVCDVVAWTSLGVLQAMVGQSGRSHWWALLAIPYVAVMFLAVRPLLRRLLVEGPAAKLTGPRFGIMLVGLLASAAATQLAGLHLIFGAFLFGLVMPKQEGSELHREVLRESQVGITLLLPVYFVVAGLNVNLSDLGAVGVLDLALAICAAVLGKFVGAYLGARSQGLSGRPALVLAVLMNTRGLTELVVLGVGLQSGLLDPSLYSIMVVVAVVTTAMSGPLLQLLARRERAGEVDAAGSPWFSRRSVRPRAQAPAGR